MSGICNCPKPTSLTAIPKATCQVNLNQIQKIGFQRNGYVFDTEDEAKSPVLLSVWQALLALETDDKLVVTPFIGADPIIEAGAAITTGGDDNSTLNGKEEIEGTGPSLFSGSFKGLSPEIEKAIKANFCEEGLTAYLFLKGGKIARKMITATTSTGLTIETPFLSDRNNAGFATKDTNLMRFSLPAGWSEDLEVFTPANWNPLTDL